MKANEIEDGKVLMIGDLVVGCIETDIVGEATYKIPCKVTDINHYGDVICEALKPFPDELDWQDGDDFSWIEPMSLTAEILEKNGWKHEFDKTDYMVKYNLGEEGKNCWMMRAIKKHNLDIQRQDENLDIYNLKVSRVVIPCDYVHELQRALRLCGITHEIIL